MRRPHIHCLRPNKRESSPDRVAWLDVESHVDAGLEEQVQTFRLGVLRVDRRHGVDPELPRSEEWSFYAPESLLALVEGLCMPSKPVTLYAYNATVDLLWSRLPLLLTEAGWTLGRNALVSDTPWAHFSKGKCSLWLGDISSWLPGGIGALAEDIGLPKLTGLDWSDSDEAWEERCRRDVEIMAVSGLACMDWWDSEHGGTWSVTGPATGMNHYRHRWVQAPGEPPIVHARMFEGDGRQHGRGHVVIHPPDETRELERRAIYGGRRETTRQGDPDCGPYGEADMVQAFNDVACECLLPRRRGAAFQSLPLDHPWLDDPALGIIAEVVLRSDSGAYPMRSSSGMLYPWGEFKTVLCGPEILEARRRGELRCIGPGRLYGLSWHMSSWARELRAALDATESRPHPSVRRMLKHWSRAVYGKWASWTSNAVAVGEVPEPDWRVTHMPRDSKGRRRSLVQMGRQLLQVTHDVEPDDCFPAILAWIQSIVRVRLRRVLEAIGAPALISWNTDSALFVLRPAGSEVGPSAMVPNAAGAGFQRVEELAETFTEAMQGGRLAAKGVYRKLYVYTGQQARLDGERRLAGVPRKVKQVGRDQFEGEVWPRMAEQLSDGYQGGVRVRRQVWDYRDVAVNRWRYECGCCRPVRCALNSQGLSVILPPHSAGCELHGARLRSNQWPELQLALDAGRLRAPP